ncbi:hypothetical protein [Rhodovulum sulfidophilum]|uniref:hypothetical protein n=1 Tax=Rhodovulum sulfidophilum TaxID=35806 RepID=UPI001923F65F|nr:hypothetical protein [Rhodovulum sulfidophilum]MBL3562229.1 hypothetical protein [Rhodovulum sulfidophilum]
MERPEWHAQLLSADLEVKMNRALAAFALLSAGVLSACQTTQVGGDGGSSSKYSRVVARDLQGGFMPNETLEFWPTVVPGEPVSAARVGIDPVSGGQYTYFSRGKSELLLPSGETWILGCRKDTIRGTTLCNMNFEPMDQGLIMNVTTSGAVRSICVGGHDFPGRRALVRIDQHPAISSDSNGCFHGGSAQRVASQLNGAQVLQTEAVKWPYDSGIQRQFALSGSYPAAKRLFRYALNADSTLFASPGE